MQGKWNDLYNFYNAFVGEEGIEIDSGPAFEEGVRGLTESLFERIRNDILEKEQYALIYGNESPDPKGYDDSHLLSIYFSEMLTWVSWMNWSGYDRVFEFDESKMLNDPVLATDGKLMSFYSEGVREAFENLFPGEIAAIREMYAQEKRILFDNINFFNGELLYFVSDGERMLTNLELDIDGQPIKPSVIIEQKVWAAVINGNDFSSSQPGLLDLYWVQGSDNASYYIALPDNILAEYENAYNTIRGIVVMYFFTAIALLICAIVFFVMLIVHTGRKRPSYENTRKLWKFDKIIVEFQIILLILASAAGFYFASELLHNLYNSWMAYTFVIYLILYGAAVFALCLVSLWFLLSLVRLLKAGLFVERSLIGRLATGPCKALADTIKSGYDGRNPLAKSLILVILLWFVTALFAGIGGMAIYNATGVTVFLVILLIAILAGAIHFTRKWAERYGQLRKGVEEITGGNLGYKIETTGDGKNEFDRLSAMVNELGSAQNTAIQNELKNQRLKTDLISNVSHDLKTPLTSIITYTDLLKTEGLKSKNAEEYLKIIDEKSRKLQKLTEDLFDAAKASSGAIQVRKEKVDMLFLINQEIAEFNGSFEGADLDLVINAENEHYFVEADSQLLWRVVDNLLRNVCKYAQPGTRVYLDFKENGSPGAPLMTTLEIKNTSSAKLNIPPEELMERFKRGDESRATEGSGLGLAIAKDLVRLMGGLFDIFIDGDLFKAVVMLPPYREET
jgi:signal transduction histidine kinase